MAFSRCVLRLLPVFLALAIPGHALAVGGSYVSDGGTARERAQVRAALDVSAFDWNAVRATVRIHVRTGAQSRSTPGQIWLDARLLDRGRYSWGFVQHEYAHQVDFHDLSTSQRSVLLGRLGGKEWWWGKVGLAHRDHGCERFASTLAWAYWPSKDNALRPHSRRDESGALAPAPFRQLLQRMMGRMADFHR
ncbi:MAG: hypothetical protein QOG06_917 [Gaiellaceae bacterium]|jgi:hypothetical protein|nr:hypothetical protein [Gaiellaceae bacterium]